LAGLLLQAAYETHGLSHTGKPVQGCQFVYKAALNDQAALQQVIQDVQPQYVVHLAAIAFVGHGNVDEFYRVNLMGTRNLLEALSQAAVKPQAVLLASSANIYGNAPKAVLTEDTQPAPANDYAVSKLAMELMAALFRDQLPLIIARPFNYTGVGQSLSFLLPKILDHFRSKADVLELGNLDVARDFSDVRTVCDVYRRLLESPAAVGDTFNVCSGQAHTLQQVLQMARDISGHDLEVRVNPAFVRTNEVKTLVGSRSKLESVIGRVNHLPLQATLEWMLQA
jgi:nucleoside-diphosphate-sugar epimerase